MDYGGSNWKSQRRKARERDGHRCVDCPVAEQVHGYELDVHHIVSYHRYKDKMRANSLENLVTLCRRCHAKRHTKVPRQSEAKCSYVEAGSRSVR